MKIKEKPKILKSRNIKLKFSISQPQFQFTTSNSKILRT